MTNKSTPTTQCEMTVSFCWADMPADRGELRRYALRTGSASMTTANTPWWYSGCLHTSELRASGPGHAGAARDVL